jgi:hypothetical protein
MTLAADLIQSAYREGNLIAAGKQPTTAEQTEALAALNRFVNGIFGYEMGENLADWQFPAPQRTAPVAANYPQLPRPDYLGPLYNSYWSPFPPINYRVVWGAVTGTVYFSDKPEPGSRMAFVQGSGAGDDGEDGSILTFDGNGRLIQDPDDLQYKTQITITSPAESVQWFYRDDLGQWVVCQDMELTDECPFPKEFDDFFICALAKRLAPRYGKITANETIETARITLSRLKARYRQSAPTVYGSTDFPRTSQSYIVGDWWL